MDEFATAIITLLPQYEDAITNAVCFELATCAPTHIWALGRARIRDLLRPYFPDPRRRVTVPNPEAYGFQHTSNGYVASSDMLSMDNMRSVSAVDSMIGVKLMPSGALHWEPAGYYERSYFGNSWDCLHAPREGDLNLPCGLILRKNGAYCILKNIETRQSFSLDIPYGMYDDYGKLYPEYRDLPNIAWDFTQYTTDSMRVRIL